MSKEKELVNRARELAREMQTWADFSNALFDPLEGLLARSFTTRGERQQFVRTAEFQEIQKLLAESVQQYGLVEGATPTRITEFMVQLHLTADNEASPGRSTVVGYQASKGHPSQEAPAS